MSALPSVLTSWGLGLGSYDFLALIIATIRTNPMRDFHLSAMGTGRQVRGFLH